MEKKSWQKNSEKKNGGNYCNLSNKQGRSFYKLKHKKQYPIENLAKNTNKQFRGRNTNYR